MAQLSYNSIFFFLLAPCFEMLLIYSIVEIIYRLNICLSHLDRNESQADFEHSSDRIAYPSFDRFCCLERLVTYFCSQKICLDDGPFVKRSK